MSTAATRATSDPFDRYGAIYRTIPSPAVAPGSFGVVVDALPDGRLIALTGHEVLLESALGSNEFSVAAIFADSILPTPSDPAFIAAHPDGTKIAVGAGEGKPLYVFESALLNVGAPTLLNAANTIVFDVAHYAGAWFDAHHLALSGGSFGQPAYVSMLDVTSDPTAPHIDQVIVNIGGSPSGVGVDADGVIYTGNGFDLLSGGSETGWIKCFTPEEWADGADFESGGTLIGDVLSAASLRFNERGDLFVGGGDFAEGDTGTLAVIRAAALAEARSSRKTIDANDPSQVRRLDPLGNGFGFYAAAFNPHTDELILADFGGWFATSGRRPGDLDGDDIVDGADLAHLLTLFGTEDPFADLNGDGAVDGADLATLLTNWGREAR